MSDDARPCPSMTPLSVMLYLAELGATWRGAGLAVECGSWLGASSRALAAGLVRAGYDRPMHCFDQWTATWSEWRKAAEVGVDLKIGENLEPRFRANVAPTYPHLVTHRGPIQRAEWTGEPIEFFILDAAKRDPAFTSTLRIFAPSWMPGVTVIGLMDFAYWRQKVGPRVQEHYRCQARFVEAHPESFVRPRGFVGSSSVFFRYGEPIEW